MSYEAKTMTVDLSGITDAVAFLGHVADTLDQWAYDSLHGGWSTHQVNANRAMADDCRRRAALLQGSISRLIRL